MVVLMWFVRQVLVVLERVLALPFAARLALMALFVTGAGVALAVASMGAHADFAHTLASVASFLSTIPQTQPCPGSAGGSC